MKRAIVLSVVLAVFVGCSRGGSVETTTVATTATVTVTATPAPASARIVPVADAKPADSKVAPIPMEEAGTSLALGRQVDAAGSHVYSVSRVISLPDREGGPALAILAQKCSPLRDSGMSWSPWIAIGSQEAVTPVGEVLPTDPRPLYPRDGKQLRGKCEEGWVIFPDSPANPVVRIEFRTSYNGDPVIFGWAFSR